MPVQIQLSDDDEELDEVKAEQQPLMTSSTAFSRKFEPAYFRWNAAATQQAVGSRRLSLNVVSSAGVIHVQTAAELDAQVWLLSYELKIM